MNVAIAVQHSIPAEYVFKDWDELLLGEFSLGL